MVVDSSGPRCGSRVARVWVVSSSYIKHKKEKGKEVLKKMTCACAYVGKPVMWTAKPGKQAQVKLQVKARGSSPTVVYPERARRKPKPRPKLKQEHGHQKKRQQRKNQRKLTLSRVLVKSSMLTVTVPSLALLLSPLGAILGLRLEAG